MSELDRTKSEIRPLLPSAASCCRAPTSSAQAWDPSRRTHILPPTLSTPSCSKLSFPDGSCVHLVILRDSKHFTCNCRTLSTLCRTGNRTAFPDVANIVPLNNQERRDIQRTNAREIDEQHCRWACQPCHAAHCLERTICDDLVPAIDYRGQSTFNMRYRHREPPPSALTFLRIARWWP